MSTLRFQIGREYLKLPPGASMELEQENPYLQYGQEIVGDISLPFQVPMDGPNMRLLHFAGLLQKRTDGTRIDARCWDGDFPHSLGKIRIEKPTVNLNRPEAGSVSCFYLTGVSSFYKDAQNIKMRDINVGGTRSFLMTDLTRNGNPLGFWQHIHAVIDAPVGAYDYAFFPVLNQGWTSGFATDVMNRMNYSGGTINFERYATQGQANRTNAAIVPFPYLKYVLVKAVEYCGWTITGAVLDDPDFKKITMLSFTAIDWRKGLNMGKYVTFDLKDSLPDTNVSTFLIWLKNRFGWAYDFDRNNKIITIRPISTIGTVVKDFTQYVDPNVPKDVAPERKGFHLKNEWNGAASQELLDLSGLIDQGLIARTADLPPAEESRENWVYLVATENNYYVCWQNLDTNTWGWELLAPNVYDYRDEGEVVEITTGANAVGSARWDSYMDFIPRMDMEGRWPGPSTAATNPNWSDEKNDHWGLYLVFYHGIRTNRSGQPIPCASHHIYDANGVQVGNWSLAFSAKKAYSGEEVGLISEWNKIADIFRSGESAELTLHLPREVFRDLRFSDAISIDSVRMYIKRIRSTIPYAGSITCECIRV